VTIRSSLAVHSSRAGPKNSPATQIPGGLAKKRPKLTRSQTVPQSRRVVAALLDLDHVGCQSHSPDKNRSQTLGIRQLVAAYGYSRPGTRQRHLSALSAQFGRSRRAETGWIILPTPLRCWKRLREPPRLRSIERRSCLTQLIDLQPRSWQRVSLSAAALDQRVRDLLPSTPARSLPRSIRTSGMKP
jgi:hypothetical protein